MCACLCVSLCYRERERERGGDMLCSLHLSGGQEWTVLLVAQFYPHGCTRAINGIDMEPHVSVWEYQCLFITCKVNKAHDTQSNYLGHFPKFYSNPTDKTFLSVMVRDKMSRFF